MMNACLWYTLYIYFICYCCFFYKCPVVRSYLWISLSLPSLLNFSIYSLLYRSCVWHCSSNIFIVSLKASIAVLFIWISWKRSHIISICCTNIAVEFLIRLWTALTCDVLVYSSYRRSYSLFFSWYCWWYSQSFLPTASMLSSFTTWSWEKIHNQDQKRFQFNYLNVSIVNVLVSDEAEVSPAGVWRPDTAAWRLVWGCTAPVTRCDSGWWAQQQSWRLVGLRSRTSHPDGIS